GENQAEKHIVLVQPEAAEHAPCRHAAEALELLQYVLQILLAFGHTDPMTSSAQSEYEFAILGAGALGSILGAHLARAGHSVVMLARGRRAQQIQSEGL